LEFIPSSNTNYFIIIIIINVEWSERRFNYNNLNYIILQKAFNLYLKTNTFFFLISFFPLDTLTLKPYGVVKKKKTIKLTGFDKISFNDIVLLSCLKSEKSRNSFSLYFSFNNLKTKKKYKFK
jgi:hypothetical protein